MIDLDKKEYLTLDDFAIFKQKKSTKKKEDFLKPVVEYSMEGVPLKEYSCGREAAKSNNISISHIHNICSGTYYCSYKLGKIFLYRGDDIEKRMSLIEKVNKHKKSIPTPVYEYTLGGKLLCIYNNAKQAAVANKTKYILILNCCKGKKLYVDKKIFLYKGEDIRQRVKEVKKELYKLSQKKPKYLPVDVFTLDGKFIKGFPSASAASRELNIHVSDITRCCHGTDGYGHARLTAKGKIFLWVGESISERLKLIKEKK